MGTVVAAFSLPSVLRRAESFSTSVLCLVALSIVGFAEDNSFRVEDVG
jgi:hypothetical protein